MLVTGEKEKGAGNEDGDNQCKNQHYFRYKIFYRKGVRLKDLSF